MKNQGRWLQWEVWNYICGLVVYGCHVCNCDLADKWNVFLSQDLENQALTEAETWREQQLQYEEQQALQNRAKQEMEAEVERYKQVMGDEWYFLKMAAVLNCLGYTFPETTLINFAWSDFMQYVFVFFLNHRSCST